MRLTSGLNKLIGGAAVAAAGGNAIAGGLDYRDPTLWIAIAIAVLQAITSLRAHQVNPNGRPAEEPFILPRREG